MNTEKLANTRLEELKTHKYLSKKCIPRISENMHYEIFKYLDAIDLLQIRSTNLGGYQLCSNTMLRSRIYNYLPEFKPIFLRMNMKEKATKINLMSEQIGVKFIFRLDILECLYKTIREVLPIFQFMPSILHLDLSNLPNKVDFVQFKKDFASLGNCLIYMDRLQFLNLGENNLDNEMIDLLSRKLYNIPNLKYLNLSYNQIENKGIKSLANNLIYIPKLEYLNLRQQWWKPHLGTEGVKVLLIHFKYIPDLQQLNLKGWDIKSDVMENFAHALTYIPKLRKLNLVNTQIGNYGLNQLSSYFYMIPLLHKLNIANCNITEEGILALCIHLKLLKELKNLNLSFNKIEENGLRILVKYFRDARELEFLDLTATGIENPSITHLAINIRQLVNLQSLRIEYNNNIEIESMRELKFNCEKLKHFKWTGWDINRVNYYYIKQLFI